MQQLTLFRMDKLTPVDAVETVVCKCCAAEVMLPVAHIHTRKPSRPLPGQMLRNAALTGDQGVVSVLLKHLLG